MLVLQTPFSRKKKILGLETKNWWKPLCFPRWCLSLEIQWEGFSHFPHQDRKFNLSFLSTADFAPSFIEHPTSRTIKEGKLLLLVCAAKGKPRLRIRWKKNGRTINADSRIKIKLSRNSTRLRLKIKKSMPEDSGDYHCVAKNDFGFTSSIKARVEIKRKRISYR